MKRAPTVLKLTLATAEQASKAGSEGISAFGFKSDPDQISLQKFYKIKQRFKCFRYDHYFNACPNGTPKCSICAGEQLQSL